MKKIFHILFCIYFFALVVVPCGDKEDCNEINHSEIAQTNDHEEHSGEVCTPFCSCACCATHVLAPDFLPACSVEITAVNSIYKVQKDSKITSIALSIWQPPKAA